MHVTATLTSIAFMLAIQGSSLAQGALEEPSHAQTQSSQTPSDQNGQSDQQSKQALLDEGQLDRVVAPIALYPDPLLAQILIASTYPLEVVQAERWMEKNKDLKGDALAAALDKEDWDDSIKALLEVPEVLSMMNEDLDWTTQLGDAVLAQQAGVMDAVQRLRALAQENGKLESNEQQTVTVKEVDVEQAPNPQPATSREAPAPQQVIVIEPASPKTVYVPYYEPSVVYGTWPYPDYPPYYFEPRPGYVIGGAIATGLAWSAGFAIGNAIWGDGFDWNNNNIQVNIDRNVNINNRNVNVANWQHDSYHRRGVNYNTTDVRNKFSKSELADKKNDFRGRGDSLADKSPDLSDKRPSLGDLEGALKKKPGLGEKGPKAGDLKGALMDKKSGGALAAKKPELAGKKPDLKKPEIKKPDFAAKKPDLTARKPDIKKLDINKPQTKRVAPQAFDTRDGAKAKAYSKRGQASVGHRSASKLSARGGGGKRGGGGRRR